MAASKTSDLFAAYQQKFRALIQTGRKPAGEPLQIVHYRETDISGKCNLSLDNDNLIKVLSKVGDKKVIILSVAGAYRTGKSFLLNYLLRYLQAEETQSDIDHIIYGSLAGFDWAGGSKRTTTGLILWSEPFTLPIGNGNQVAVLLLDTHGLFDDRTPMHVASLLVSLSVLISSVQVYNVKNVIGENHLQTLELIATTASMALAANNCSAPFQRLVFLVRDWCDEARYDYGEEGGAGYITEKLAATPKELRAVRENIGRAFSSLECFLMPSPGEFAMKTPGQREMKRMKDPFTGKFESLTLDFQEFLPNLAKFLFSSSRLASEIKLIGGNFATAREIIQHIQSVVSLFQSGELPPPNSTAQALLDEYNRGIMKNNLVLFQKEMEANIKATDPKDATSLDAVLKSLDVNALSSFDRQSQGTREQVAGVRASLRGKLDEMKTMVRQEYDAKWRGIEGKKTLEAFKRAKMTYRHIMEQYVGELKPYQKPSSFIDIHSKAKAQALDAFSQDVTQYNPETGYKEELKSDLECHCEEKRSMYNTKNELNNNRQGPSYSQLQDLYNDEDESTGTLGKVLNVLTLGLKPLVKWIWKRATEDD